MEILKRKLKPNEHLAHEIGGLDAGITPELLKQVPELKKALQKISKRLIFQLKCDGIEFTSISFGRRWIKRQ